MARLKTVHLRDQDEEVVAYLDGLKNFSQWVRQKAASDIARQKTGIDPEIAAYIDRVLDVRLSGITMTAAPSSEEPQAEDAVRGDIERMF